MPRFPIRLVALPVSVAMLSAATPGIAEPAPSSPFLGAWELDLARMPATYGPTPKRVVYTFTDADAGQWRTSIDITAPDDSIRHMTVTYRRDGQPGRSEGDLSEGDSAAVSAPAANVLVMSIAKDKALASVRTYTVSADGREMIEAAADVDGAGAPYVRRFVFKRAG